MLVQLAGVIEQATAALEDYEHARALDLIERFFWGFTDDYLELVKGGRTGRSGRARQGPRSARCGWRSRSCCGCSRRFCRT